MEEVSSGDRALTEDAVPIVRGREPFEVFYRREYDRTVRLAYVLSGSRWGAEDLAQEAFAAAHNRWDAVCLYESRAADGIGNVPGSGTAIGWRPTDIAVADGVVWVATMGGGVSYFDGQAWRTVDSKMGLPTSEVAEIDPGREGELWMRLGEDGQRIAVFTTP